MLKYHKAKGGYKYFEKYTDCEHKKNNQLGSDCQACDIAWLISRCEILEKIIENNSRDSTMRRVEMQQKTIIELEAELETCRDANTQKKKEMIKLKRKRDTICLHCRGI
jgi:hypothetical protein